MTNSVSHTPATQPSMSLSLNRMKMNTNHDYEGGISQKSTQFIPDTKDEDLYSGTPLQEKPLQGKFSDTVQLEEAQSSSLESGGFNQTGIPDDMKEGFESMSGLSFDDVQVHYNSDKPEKVQARAYTQGNEVHISPGQEKHLGHELGHVVQQKQGRVRPTMQLQGMNVNDNEGLEREADVMGKQILQKKPFVDGRKSINKHRTIVKTIQNLKAPIQCFTEEDLKLRAYLISQRKGGSASISTNGFLGLFYSTILKTEEKSQAEKELIAEEIYNQSRKKGGNFWDLLREGGNPLDLLKERINGEKEAGIEQSWNSAVVMHKFREKEYKKDRYKLSGYGCFDARYIPYNKDLNISLPVFFKTGFPNDKVNFFINKVEDTWSNKFSIKCEPGKTHDGQEHFASYTKKVWKTTLNPVKVNIKAEKKDREDEAYFKIESGATTSSVSPTTGVVKLRDGAIGIGGNIDDFSKRNTVGHETGHMFGLADEYIVRGNVAGHKTRHYDLTEKAFGKEYADEHATQQNSTDVNRKDNIMNSGTEVRKHHYVTFWDAMVQAIQTDYGAPASDIAPNQHDDWKIT